MRAGNLIHRITLQKKSVTRNDVGDEIITWVDQGTPLWAQALPATQQSKELFTADQPKAAAVVAFKIRYLSTVTPELRLIWNGVVHEILSVADVKGELTEMEILARAGVSNV